MSGEGSEGAPAAPAEGSLRLEQLAHLVEADEIDTVLVAFPDLYGRLMGKRFDARFFLDSVAHDGTHGCDYLLTVDMEMDPVPGYSFANWERGYGDFHLEPDLRTLRRITWLDRSALVLCDLRDVSSHDLVEPAPRSLLRRQVDAAAEAGFS